MLLAAGNVNAAPVEIHYQLPAAPVPQAYLVTLAITDPKDPEWIVSTFLTAGVRIVSHENGGRFTETWNGLDENLMPLPSGRYGLKGIYSKATRWSIDGQYHAFIPKLAVAAGDCWMPAPARDDLYPWLSGAGFGTWSSVAVGANNRASFYHNFLENSLNPYLVDLNKPIGFDQVIKGFPSGGVGGGGSTATDGAAIWCDCVNGLKPMPFLFRADRAFGSSRSTWRNNVTMTTANTSAMVAGTFGRRPLLYVAGGGVGGGISVFDGDSAELLARVSVDNPRALMLSGTALTVMRQDKAGAAELSSCALSGGLPTGRWNKDLGIAGIANPTDCVRNEEGDYFVSDADANQVYEMNGSGAIVRLLGSATPVKPGAYNPLGFLSPGKLAVRRDSDGQERLIVVERSGAGRVSEWSMQGTLLREWIAGVVAANVGYAVDPEDSDHVYMAAGQTATGFGLLRFHLNYQDASWGLDGFWPGICGGDKRFPGGQSFPRLLRVNGRKYLAFARHIGSDFGYMIYRQAGEDWAPSACIFPDASRPGEWRSWHNATGSGEIDGGVPFSFPSQPRYWGEKWLDDLSLVVIENGGRSLWRLPVARFDALGNPVYESSDWKRLLTDSVKEQIFHHQADPLHGGNEVSDRFVSAWDSVDGSMERGFYVNSYGGPACGTGVDSSGRYGSETKVSFYSPDGKGGFRIRWRVGRKAFGLAKPGEIYGPLHVTAPVNGVLGVQDGNGLYHLFTDDGLYIDTLLVDCYARAKPFGGVYSLGGELFNGYHFLNKSNGKAYLAMGRNSAEFFEIQGLSRDRNGIERIPGLEGGTQITADQIAPADERALRVRAPGQGIAKTAVFNPCKTPPSMDCSMRGWDAAGEVTFESDQENRVEARLLFDPNTIYLRWRARQSQKVQVAPAGHPERIFTHDTAATTLSFYFAAPSSLIQKLGMSLGDCRIVFGLQKSGNTTAPIAVGLYPSTIARLHPVTYTSAVSSATFADVAPLTNVKLSTAQDGDGKGFVLCAAVPRIDIPFSGALHAGEAARVDFSATVNGKLAFWWCNLDGSASTNTSDEPSEAALYPSAWGTAEFK